MSPCSRTMALLRSEGWTVDKTEQRLPIPGRFITRDTGGFADGIAWAPGRGILAWQATSGSNVSARLDKISALPSALAWLQAPARLEVFGWRLAGPCGARKTWQVRRVMLGIRDARIVSAEIE